MKFVNNRTTAVGVGAAMLVTLGGVGGAVAANTIGSKDIKDNSVRSVDVRDGNLGMRDMNRFTQDRINQPGPKGERGPAGPQGEQGPAGPAGEDGVSGYEVRSKEVVLPAGGAPTTVVIDCGENKVALGGGYKVDTPTGVNVFHNMGANLTKQSDGTWSSNAWEVRAVNSHTAKTNLTAFTTCASVN